MDRSARQVRDSAHRRYPKAVIHALDNEYTVPEIGLWDKAYSQFIFQMKIVGLGSWLANKLDCDKWSWLFKAYITVRNALSRRKNALPVGILCYYVDADKSKPHCINTVMAIKGNGTQITEIEPQPRNGLGGLTKAERDTAWLVIF